MVTIGIELSEEVIEKARNAGLLTSEKITELLEAEIKRQRKDALDQFLETSKLLEASMREQYGNLSDEEAQALIDQWIDEARAEQNDR